MAAVKPIDQTGTLDFGEMKTRLSTWASLLGVQGTLTARENASLMTLDLVIAPRRKVNGYSNAVLPNRTTIQQLVIFSFVSPRSLTEILTLQ
jgi:hypothetical protein